MYIGDYNTANTKKTCGTAFEHNSKVGQLIELLKDPKVQSVLKIIIDSAIATSELNLLKRLAKVEQFLGLDDYGTNETDEPTLMQRVEAVEETIKNAEVSFKPPSEPEIQATTKTEERAVALVDHAKDTGKDHLTAREITSFLKSKLPDSCKIDENIQNIRKVKQDVLNKAASMYPDVFLSKKSTGHREVRLVMSTTS